MKIIKRKSVFLPILAWLILCFVTVLVFYKDLHYLRWIDIPTHFAAGVMLATISFIISKRNIKKAIFLSFLIFIAWEFFEIAAAATSKREFVINIFEETKLNRIQDVLMDTLGLVSFFFVYNKYRLKRVTEYISETKID
ncbi:hypothetical protein K0B03_04415 [Patescibacteria group bacterium]|nr:hypothetical protein [Patescibacteria group bacterium]